MIPLPYFESLGYLSQPAKVDLDRLKKPEPRVIAKAEKKQTKDKAEAAFRLAVWERDRGQSRASGKPLGRSGTASDRIGEVHHVLARSTDPDKRLDVSNGILLSRAEHQLAETACAGDPSKCYLDINGPVDRGKPQVFIWRDSSGKELRRRQG